MTKRFTSAGAMLAMRAVTGDYYLALGKGQSATGLVDEASVEGYARQPVTIVAKRATGTNAAPATFGTFAANGGSCAYSGLYTAAMGGTCIWVGPLPEAVDIVAGGSVTIPAGALSLTIALVDTATVATVAPANTAPPVISGTARDGEILTASTGTWTGTAPITYAFQWQRGTTAIAGATAATYTAQAADVGQALRVIVSASNSAGAARRSPRPTPRCRRSAAPPSRARP